MSTKEIITLITSGFAIIISLVSLGITLYQKRQETKRTIRKTLTDTLEVISKINIDLLKMENSTEKDFNSEISISIRRNCNSQKRILMANAQYLIENNQDIATDIDCCLVAGANADIGNIEIANKFWNLAVQKSKEPEILLMNLRGYAMFKYNIDEPDEGRKLFLKAAKTKLKEIDNHLFLIADTYVMLAKYDEEIDKKFFEEHIRCAMDFAYKIKSKKRQNEMHARIMKHLGKP